MRENQEDKVVEKYYFLKVREKSEKMILDHADCRYLSYFLSRNILKNRQICSFH